MSMLVMGVLHKVERGMSIVVVRCCYGGTEPTICFIKKKEEKIRGSGMIHVPSSSKTYCVSDYDLFLKNIIIIIIIYSSIFVTQVTLDMSIIIYNLYITSLTIYGLPPTTV